jgi:hypothetical protein
MIYTYNGIVLLQRSYLKKGRESGAGPDSSTGVPVQGPGFNPQHHKNNFSRVLLVHACNPSYLGGLDQEDHSFRPAQASISRDAISKVTRAKWTSSVAPVL